MSTTPPAKPIEETYPSPPRKPHLARHWCMSHYQATMCGETKRFTRFTRDETKVNCPECLRRLAAGWQLTYSGGRPPTTQRSEK